MLNQLDTLIGFAVVMGIVSLLITIITQFVSSLLALRGKNLVDALEAMIYKIDPKIDQQTQGLAKSLARKVLTHPAISDSSLSMSKPMPRFLSRIPKAEELHQAWKLASAIRADELLERLGDIAGAATVPVGAMTTVEQAAARLLQEQRSVEKWFDATMIRAKQWFAMHTRIITVIASLLMALALQLDSFEQLHRISSDSELRSSLRANTAQIQDLAKQVSNQNESNINVLGRFTNRWDSLIAESGKTGIELIPNPYPRPFAGAWCWPKKHLLGILISAALLSLGAPFWFNILKSLANLRPVLSNRIDEDEKAKK